MKRAVRIGLAGLMGAMVLGGMPSALASHGGSEARRSGGGGGGIENSGPCSAGSTWKLKGKPDDGRLEVEFEVDQNVVGDTWKVVMKDNGTVFFRGQRPTQAPSGSFEVNRRPANMAGTDTIQARAKNLSTGEVCQGSIAI